MAVATLLRTSSPVGRIELRGDGSSLTGLSIERGGALPGDRLPESPDAVLRQAAAQLAEYFAGARQEFELPLRAEGTEFQRAVWARLAELPFGSTVEYRALAGAVGRPLGARAVGGAVGANPIPIVVPCHRVLGSGGRLTGYSGGEGVPTKEWLLRHEGAAHQPGRQAEEEGAAALLAVVAAAG